MPTEGRTGLEELGFLRDLAAQDNGTYRASAGDLDYAVGGGGGQGGQLPPQKFSKQKKKKITLRFYIFK